MPVEGAVHSIKSGPNSPREKSTETGFPGLCLPPSAKDPDAQLLYPTLIRPTPSSPVAVRIQQCHVQISPKDPSPDTSISIELDSVSPFAGSLLSRWTSAPAVSREPTVALPTRFCIDSSMRESAGPAWFTYSGWDICSACSACIDPGAVGSASVSSSCRVCSDFSGRYLWRRALYFTWLGYARSIAR